MNPPDLIDAYFKRDLSEAEDEALAQSLAKDLGQTSRFSSAAAAAWAKTGLPEPGPAGAGGLKPWHFGVFAAILALSAGLVFWAWPNAASLAPLPTTSDAGFALEEPAQAKPFLAPPVQMQRTAPKALGIKPLMLVEADGLHGFMVQVASHRPLPNTRVLVQDPQGRVMAVLHEGRLGAGGHTLRWLGRAKPGRYKVVLKGPSLNESRWVEVHGR
jgi:hypothetical protein